MYVVCVPGRHCPLRGSVLALILWHMQVVLGGGIGVHLGVVLGWYWVVLGGIGRTWAPRALSSTSRPMPTASKDS